MLPSASALASRREERVRKAFSVDHHGPGNARLSHGAIGIYGALGDTVQRRHRCRGPLGGRVGCDGQLMDLRHSLALLAVGTDSTMAQTGVSGPVVVDGESFLDALFASAGQG